MTTIQLIDQADSGDIHGVPGEGPTEDLRHHMNRRDTTGELTENLGPRIAEMDGLQPWRRPTVDRTVKGRLIEPALGMTSDSAPPIIEMDQTVIYHVATSLAGAVATIDGDLKEPPKASYELRRSVPYVLPDDRKPWSGPRHAQPAPAWTKWAIGVGALLAIWAAVTLAVVL